MCARLKFAMSLVSGFPQHPGMHHHENPRYSLHAAAASRRQEDGVAAPQYFTSWVISRADLPPAEYTFASGYSPEYQGSPGSTGGLDSHFHHLYGPAALLAHGVRNSETEATIRLHHHPHPRAVKRRPTANRKERRRTQSINSAFAELRECIPNVPADTKLSKIKTLRLATSYISYLMDILDKDGQQEDTLGFKAELKTEAREGRRKRESVEILKTTSSSSSPLPSKSLGDKKTKGRTGWPQHVWALELHQ